MTDIIIRRFGAELRCLVFVDFEIIEFGKWPELLREAGVQQEVIDNDFQKPAVIPE